MHHSTSKQTPFQFESADIGAFSNAANWIATDENSFLVRLKASDNPAHTHSDLNTELLFAESGGREAYRRQALEQGMQESQLAALDSEVPTDPNEYVWMNPYNKSAPGNERDAQLKIEMYAIFGRQGFTPKTDGVLVCEATMLGVVGEKNGAPVSFPNGLLLDRFKITKTPAEKGGFVHELVLQPFKNRDVIYDYMLSFARQRDDRNRYLLLEFYAPDEQTFEWKPVYNATFGVDYRFTSLELENRLHSPEYMKLDVVQSPEEATASRNLRLRQVQATMKDNTNVAIFTHTPQQEVRVLGPQAVSFELATERATWLYNDASKIYAGLKRQRSTNEDLEEAMRQELAKRMAE